MDTNQAAKLAQAYQWLSEGKGVDARDVDTTGWSNAPQFAWRRWNGVGHSEMEFRLTPEPEPLLECWANITKSGQYHVYATKAAAEVSAAPCYVRTAVHLREVRDEQ